MMLNLYRNRLPERYRTEIQQHRREDNDRALPLLVLCCLAISAILLTQHSIAPVPYAVGRVGQWYRTIYLVMVIGAGAYVPIFLIRDRLPARITESLVAGFYLFMLNWSVALSFIDIAGGQGYDAVVLGSLAFAVLYRASIQVYVAVLGWLVGIGAVATMAFFMEAPGPARMVPYFNYAGVAFAVSIVLESGRLETAMLRADLRNTNEELRDLSMHDPLTGLYNRHYLNEFLSRQVPFARRQNQGISFLILDLDKFKDVNDRFGHLTGDRVLTQVAKRLQESVREYDLLFRYGGEEFLVVLINTRLEEACVVAERIRQNVEADDFQLPDRNVTVSIGAASIPRDGELGAALAAADSRLYAAKAAGRNVCISA